MMNSNAARHATPIAGHNAPRCARRTILLLVGSIALLAAPLIARPAEPRIRELPRDNLRKPLPLRTVPKGLHEDRRIPADNALTESRVNLGRRLFFDPLLSADRSISCASCHQPAHGFAGIHPTAVGVAGARGRRNSPSLLNRTYGDSFFWDGRAGSLEEQALQPIENPLELATTVPEVIDRLRADADYPSLFAHAYEGGISAENLARALASFQRVLLSGDSAVDRFLAAETSALTIRQKQGMWLFDSRGGCWKCHSGSNYTDESFHNTGVSWGKVPWDLGRYHVTRQDKDRGRFKTPSLRDVARTPPYMHDGSMKTLEEVVQFYNRGGGPNPYRDQRIKPLGLSGKEVGFLVEFLNALTGSTDWSTGGNAGGAN